MDYLNKKLKIISEIVENNNKLVDSYFKLCNALLQESIKTGNVRQSRKTRTQITATIKLIKHTSYITIKELRGLSKLIHLEFEIMKPKIRREQNNKKHI